MSRILPALAIWLLLPALADAAPVNYALQSDRSEVAFVYRLSGVESRGTMPVSQARILIDFDTFTASSVDVSVDVRGARTDLIFATEALKVGSVLDARNHPIIRFQSTAIRPNDLRNLSAGGKIDGLLTIRGVTRPVTLDASLFRQQGTEAGDLSQLSFRISGAIDRSAFGANGYRDLVADMIKLDIAARVVRAE
jgi:polyisoprenoid-binding protein YceI